MNPKMDPKMVANFISAGGDPEDEPEDGPEDGRQLHLCLEGRLERPLLAVPGAFVLNDAFTRELEDGSAPHLHHVLTST